ncbi:MAG: hypothetical protein JOZ11_09020 [Alphaproteobacteria bacterium]|nr:hypothetical protein [Alphaproteobacteria bacterium]
MKQKLVSAALLVATVIFSLVALEVGLRAYTGQWNYVNLRTPPNPNSVFFGGPVDFDAELGWVPKEHAQVKVFGPWRTTVTMLEHGIRSNGSAEVRDATKPILAVGDSFTFGDDVSDWETWPAQLEKLSGRRVINGGVFAYGIDQAFLRARRLLGRYRFSTVIFSFIPDDIRRCQMSVAWGAPKPYFRFEDKGLALENVPVPPPSKKGGLLIALEHSQVVHSVMKRLFPAWWLGGSIQVQDEEKGVEVACAVLHELERLTTSRGAQLIVLVQYDDAEISLPSAAVEGNVKGVLNCLSDPATRVLDLKPALSEMKARDLSTYNGLFRKPGLWTHMTAEGNRFVSLEILKVLTPWINAG